MAVFALGDKTLGAAECLSMHSEKWNVVAGFSRGTARRYYHPATRSLDLEGLLEDMRAAPNVRISPLAAPWRSPLPVARRSSPLSAHCLAHRWPPAQIKEWEGLRATMRSSCCRAWPADALPAASLRPLCASPAPPLLSFRGPFSSCTRARTTPLEWTPRRSSGRPSAR